MLPRQIAVRKVLRVASVAQATCRASQSTVGARFFRARPRYPSSLGLRMLSLDRCRRTTHMSVKRPDADFSGSKPSAVTCLDSQLGFKSPLPPTNNSPRGGIPHKAEPSAGCKDPTYIACPRRTGIRCEMKSGA